VPAPLSIYSVAIDEHATYSKITWRLIPFLFVCYIVAFLDRVNVGFAKLQMAPDLGFSDAVYGFGAGIFFLGYFAFEVPSNVILQRVGARVWIARIMITWGVLSSAFMFTGHVRWGPVAAALNCTDAELTFYVLRFLLGIAEAGFFPGIILYLTYWFPAARRAGTVALFMTSVAISNVIGAPVSGAIMQFMDGWNDWRGWQWLFLVEGLPAVILGALVFALLPDRPSSARWLSPREREIVLCALSSEDAITRSRGGHGLVDAFRDLSVWALALVYFCGVVCLYAVNFWMPTIVQELSADDVSFLRVGMLTAIPWATAAIAMVWWARHSDRTGERRWHAAGGLLIACAGLLVLAWTADGSVVVSIAALTMVTVGVLSSLATFWSIPTAFLSGTAAAAGIAWINSVGNLGGHVGPDLIGRVRTISGGSSDAAFLALAGLALVGALTVVAIKRR
jgi:MFS transporter, ACS family, tartrate transporter